MEALLLAVITVAQFIWENGDTIWKGLVLWLLLNLRAY